MAIRYLGIAMLMLATSILVLRVTASVADSGGCSFRTRALILLQCKKFINNFGPEVTPSDQCCEAMRTADIPCLCEHVPKSVELIISMKKFVDVATTCGSEIPPTGSKCGSYTIPSTPEEPPVQDSPPPPVSESPPSPVDPPPEEPPVQHSPPPPVSESPPSPVHPSPEEPPVQHSPPPPVSESPPSPVIHSPPPPVHKSPPYSVRPPIRRSPPRSPVRPPVHRSPPMSPVRHSPPLPPTRRSPLPPARRSPSPPTRRRSPPHAIINNVQGAQLDLLPLASIDI